MVDGLAETSPGDLPLAIAASIGEHFGGRLERFARSGYSKRFSYSADADRLLVVSPSPDDGSARQALAHGLSYSAREKRQLILALPSGSTETSLWRLPWVGAPVYVFEFHHDLGRLRWCRSCSAPTRTSVLERVIDNFGRPPHDLGEMADWVQVLIEWANAHPHLVAAHRTSGLVWKCRRRKVLECKRQGRPARVSLVGGVVGKHFRPPVKRVIAKQPSKPEELDSIQAAVEGAIEDLLHGDDKGDPEHTLQAYLARRPDLLDLDPHAIQLEFPALRAGCTPGFIDLMGADGSGHVHLVETKIGDDVMLVLQRLDYWIWAQKHAGDFASLYNTLSDPVTLQLDYVVVLAEGRSASAHIDAQLDALADDVRWRLLTLPRFPLGASSFDAPDERPQLQRKSRLPAHEPV